MNITIIGAGYVGLVTAASFAELGNNVYCVDINKKKISDLKKAKLPIYEPGLTELISSNILAKRLHFTTMLEEIPDPEVIFIAVGTPALDDGRPNMQFVLDAAIDIGSYLKKYCVIVDKSTVPIGMAERVKSVIQNEIKKRGLKIKFDIVSNPEFLREGTAIVDFMNPDRVIIGVSSKKAKEVMLDLYMPLIRNPEKIFFMTIKDAEMTKYAANAMLATKISFMNEIAALCERMGVDVENVRLGIGSDSRIGNDFIYPGCGYGGSCFPKDVKALIQMSTERGFDPFILKAVDERNYYQKRILSNKIIEFFGNDLTNYTIGVWGLSFKPGTDDMREASSLVLIENLIAHKARVQAYDPIAIPVAKKKLPNDWVHSGQLTFTDNQYEASRKADALILVTEWKPFCYPDFALLKKLMRRHIILDGRNQYDQNQIREAGFDYYGIGRG